MNGYSVEVSSGKWIHTLQIGLGMDGTPEEETLRTAIGMHLESLEINEVPRSEISDEIKVVVYDWMIDGRHFDLHRTYHSASFLEHYGKTGRKEKAWD